MVLDLSLPALQAILAARTAALDEPLHLYAAAARALRPVAPARADFIDAQCGGEVAEDLFDIYREAWDVPTFDEGLVCAADFRRGFLWTFRDHTSSWSQDALARRWFFTSPEAQFARRLELWNADAGEEELTYAREGDYGELVRAIFGDGEGDLVALVSAAFSAAEFSAQRERLVAKDPGLRDLLAWISVQRGS